jgi:serine/threonine protein kinase
MAPSKKKSSGKNTKSGPGPGPEFAAPRLTLATIEAGIRAAYEARCPEDVFGNLGGDRAITAPEVALGVVFKGLAMKLHPDVLGNGKEEADAMACLTELRSQAEAKIAAGTYGQRHVAANVVIKLGRNIYDEVTVLAAGDISDVYSARAMLPDADGKPNRPVVIKIARSPMDRDLVSNEVKILRQLAVSTFEGHEHFRRYLPRFIEAADIDVGGVRRPAVVVRRHVETHTATEVLRAFPSGLEPRDAAWMWRRLLEVLAWVGQQGIVHGAVLPDHLLVRPVDHGGKLLDWSYSVPAGSPLRAMVPWFESFYAPEVRKKLPATPATDVYMAAKIAIYLHGGDIEMETLPDSVPRPIAHLIESCLIMNPHRRYASALEVYKQYDVLLQKLYGPPSFRPFAMPGEVAAPPNPPPPPPPSNPAPPRIFVDPGDAP